MRLLIRWALLTLALLLAVKLVPGLQPLSPWYKLFLASLALAAINLVITPVVLLVRLITLPLSCLTLGLWTLFLTLFFNTLAFYFVGTLNWGWGFSPNDTSGQRLMASFFGALIVSVANAILVGLYSQAMRRERG